MEQELVPMTPLMRQYHDIKIQHAEALVFFQVGDFYELFFDDAHKASSYLGIALTSRGTYNNQPIPLCGVPVHTINNYLAKLVKGGFRVVMCDQITEPQPGKIVQRAVAQVFTPGTLIDDNLLEATSASYLAALVPTNDAMHLAFVELLTGNVSLTTVVHDECMLQAELARFSPDEILVFDTKLGQQYAALVQRQGYITTTLLVNDAQDLQQAFSSWLQQLAPLFLKQPTMSVLLLIYAYLHKHHPRSLDAIKELTPYQPDNFLLMDAATQRNLELTSNNYDGTRTNSLLTVLDTAITAMGSRTIKKWLLRPLVNRLMIEQRLDAVEQLYQHHAVREQLRAVLALFGDLERVVGRVSLRRALLQDYQRLIKAMAALPQLVATIDQLPSLASYCSWRERTQEFNSLQQLLAAMLNDDQTKPWKIKEGFHSELDRLRGLVEHGARAIAELERQEQVATGIPSLKIRYNRAHGYGIEVTKPNAHLVPVHYIRHQTLLNRERFITQDLKDLEYDLSHAQGAIEELEQTLFSDLAHRVYAYVAPLRSLAQSLAELDAIAAFAHNAASRGYIRPVMHEGHDISIIAGRHPVVEVMLGQPFIPNDTNLNDDESLWIITGPNMGGKSTYLRQVALICIMAQAGSFVPATRALLPIIDRIFTRIGAADKVAEGKSTFLVEMEETALICRYATPRSFVILDEVGRGTSTYDGLAIAQAVVEYIHTVLRARCLFATHYHELTQLAQAHAGIASYYVASSQTAEGIVLLHMLIKGITDGSFGIEVARKALLPLPVIQRAQDILKNLKHERTGIAT